MFLQESRKSLTDLIMRCRSSMVKVQTDAEEVLEPRTFLLTAILTAMPVGLTGRVLRLIDRVQCRNVATGRV